jgi:hypothetical protein
MVFIDWDQLEITDLFKVVSLTAFFTITGYCLWLMKYKTGEQTRRIEIIVNQSLSEFSI